MRSLFKIIACLLCLSVLLLAAGCGGSYKDAYIYYELGSIPKTLDPQLVKTDDEATVVRCLYDTLLRYDANGKLVPSAAESYTVNGLVYTFKLKEDATWTDGTPVTAYDFRFGLYRALTPETASPFAETLLSIKNADKVLAGTLPLSSLGVTVVDNYTLKIELKASDPEFLNTLTTPISMPCNEAFFTGCKATYGLTLESLLLNGSYYVRIWDTEESFLIRLAKNLEFTGPFEANSMRMYFTCPKEDGTENIIKGNSDLGFVSAEEVVEIKDAGLNALTVQSQCFMLTLGKNIDKDLRTALISSVNFEGFSSLPSGYRIAENIYPSSLKITDAGSISDTISYDVVRAAEIYNNLVKKGNQFSLVLRYVDNPVCEMAAKAIAAHWQQKLGIFINIEKVNLDYATLLLNGDESAVIMPFTSFGGSYSSYVTTFGSKALNPKTAQAEILSSYCYLPLFFSDKYIAYNDYIKIYDEFISYGVPDLALITKNE